MRKTLFTGLVVGLLTIVMAVPALASNGMPDTTPDRPGARLTVTVTGGDHDVVYNSIALGDLPMEGRFQQLFITDSGPETEYGPGDPGYLGGRWWVDANGDGEMNEGDAFFLCPLLGRGHTS